MERGPEHMHSNKQDQNTVRENDCEEGTMMLIDKKESANVVDCIENRITT